jgi:hypothetical protein
MKAIRYLASILLLAAGVVHIILFIRGPRDLVSAVVLAFGIIYFAIGILLFLKIKYSTVSGILFPLIGIIVGLTAFDPAQRTPLLGILGIADVTIVILCTILEWDRRREAKYDPTR